MIEILKTQIVEANEAYRLGNPIISDVEYDELIDKLIELSPNDDLLKTIGHKISDESRKSKLPIEMASMCKIKTIDDINDWTRLKNIKKSELVIITPKYDGLSLCVNEKNGKEAWTRGDGKFGQKSDKHYEFIGNKLSTVCKNFDFTYGEVMMPKSTFLSKYSNDFANPRNLVAGLLNSKEATPTLLDCNYIKYGAHTNNDKFTTKQDIIEELNLSQEVKVPYHICKISELTEELLINLFNQYSIEYEIDGLIIEINDLNRQNELGRETSSNNPVWARAFKHSTFEQSAQTEVIGISWNISKNGLLKPTIHINPIKLDGVTVSNVTGNNARYIKDMGIGISAKVVVKRSGFVIPIIADVLEKVDWVMPNIPNIDWNKNGVELVTLNETDDQKLKKNIAFFEILEADNVSEGVITQLWDAGYKTIKDILNLSKLDLEKIDRFGKRKAQIVYDSIQKSIKDVELSKLQHASGIFKNMGSKKLKLLEHFKEKPSIDDVLKIDGIGEILANEYINSYDDFFTFISDLPINIKEDVKVEGGNLEGMIFVFTGIRLKTEQDIIESRGARVASSVSKNTTHVVCKDKNSSSSKIVKAKELGLTIMDVEEFLNFIK